MDSTMYFFSGEYTCLNVIPAGAVISVKRTSLGRITLAVNDPARDKITSGAISLTFPKVHLMVIPACLISSLTQLFRDLDLALTLGLPPSGNVGLTQLVMEL